MKTLDELIKEKGLIPSSLEILGRTGNYVHIEFDKTYTTLEEIVWDVNIKEVIEVKPE